MDIKVNNLLSATQYAPIRQQRTKADNSFDAIRSSSAGIVTISSAAQNLSNSSQGISKGGSGTYDFTNMTAQQMASTMNNLISTGKMSVDQSTSLVGEIGFAGAGMQFVPSANGGAPEVVSPNSTSENKTANFIALLQSGMESAKSRNDTAEAESMESALNVLLSYQGTPITK